MVSAVLRVVVRDVPLAALSVPRAAERVVRDRIGRASLAIIDTALASPYADVAVQRVLSSGVAERAVERALSSELVDVVANDLVRYEVVERVVEQMLAGGVLDRALERAVATGVPERLADEIVERALESPGIERVVDRIVESRLLEETVTRVVEDVATDLPSSEALWALIDVIAQSPAVTEAITQQSFGFADQVADEVRERSRRIDARLERGAWRLLRRRQTPAAGGQAPPAAGTT